MKHLFITLSTVLLIATGAFAQAQPEMEFEVSTHDYGNIPQNVPAEVRFKFKNIGAAPLIISNAEGSCGCTVPEWPKEPIGPGKTGEIKVIYDAKKVGAFQKSVTITSNDPNSPAELRIKGEVKEAEG